GYAVADITPPVGTPMSGYPGVQSRSSRTSGYTDIGVPTRGVMAATAYPTRMVTGAPRKTVFFERNGRSARLSRVEESTLTRIPWNAQDQENRFSCDGSERDIPRPGDGRRVIRRPRSA